MRSLLFITFISCCISLSPAGAVSEGELEYEILLSLEKAELDGLTLGSDTTVDRLEEEEFEIEFKLEYQVNEHVFVFFGGSLFDDSETLESAGISESGSGFERKLLGAGVTFGEEIESELTFGRLEFESLSEWWVWWDEELDAIRLESEFGNFESLIAIAQEQARESTDLDFIDPEINGIQRTLASLAWEFADHQSLLFYYLDQKDNSSSHIDGEAINFKKADEEDADLRWSGVSYFGEFDIEKIGEVSLEVNFARVSGDETVYEFSDPAANVSTVDDIEKNSIEGTARGILISWTPAVYDEWTLIVGQAKSSGDSNLDDNKIKSYRQSSLQGDSESFGELFQPELSNVIVTTVGIKYEAAEGVEIGLYSHAYRQDKLDPELRDTSIDLDTTGLSRDLGREIDLVVTIEAYDGFEIELIAAEFDPGKAYGSFKGDTSRYWSLELSYEF